MTVSNIIFYQPLYLIRIEMKRDPVQSSNIESIGYDHNAATLEVKFHSGEVYQYTNVPESVYKGLFDAESKGRYFHTNIRGKYPFNKIEGKENKSLAETKSAVLSV